MGLLQKLLSAVGLRESEPGRRSDRSGETTVTVEHEPDASTESAVKGGGAAAGSTAASSTDTVTDTADEEPGAAEPAEAAGATAGDVDEEPDTEDELDEEDTTDGERASNKSTEVLNGIGPAYADRLAEAGVETVADLAAADAGDLADATGLGEGRIGNWIEQAEEY